MIFTSYDGYSTSLPLDFVVSRNLLLAYGMNGQETRAGARLPVPGGR